jgi:hypothetical protein
MLEEVLAFVSIILDLLFLQIEHVSVHVLLEGCGLDAGPQLFLTGFNEVPAHHLQAFVEIFEGKHDASTRGQSLNLAATIPEAS